MTARAALIAAIAASGPAGADHFTSIDLGPVANRDACMARAETVFGIYGRAHGTEPLISSGTWTISAWDLPPLGADVTVLCVEVGGVWNAFATAHLSGDGEPPDATVEQIRDMFTK